MNRRDLLLGAAAVFLVRDALAQGKIQSGVNRVRGEATINGQPAKQGMAVRAGDSLVSGAVLSVFGPRQRRELRTSTATIGIRGTAVYIEAEAQRTYVCTCYGEAVLEPLAEPAARETVRTTHHEQPPRYIMGRGAPQMVTPAPMINHSDAELELLESLVGRQPPFVGKSYPRY